LGFGESVAGGGEEALGLSSLRADLGNRPADTLLNMSDRRDSTAKADTSLGGCKAVLLASYLGSIVKLMRVAVDPISK
jgi:hypothetical protein